MSWFESSETEYYDFLTDAFHLDTWYAVCVSVVLWTTLYFAVRYTFHTKSPEWCNRLVTLFHGLGTAIRGLQECCQEGEWAFENPDEESTHNQMLILVISLGYFLFDLGWCLAYETETKLMIFHHIYSCVALYRVLVSEVSGAQAACGLAAMEFTNPFLQLRWFLRSEGFYNTVVFKFVEISFIALFFVIRILLGTYFFIVIMFVYPNGWEFRLLTLVIYLLSWMFLINIAKFVFLKYIQHNMRYLETEIRNDMQTST